MIEKEESRQYITPLKDLLYYKNMNIHFYRILFFLLLSGFVAYIIYLRAKMANLIKAVNVAMHNKSEIGNFLSIFSKSLKKVEEIEDSMNITARYVADLVGASSVGIFIIEDNYLKAVGIAGAFPPLHKSPEYVLTKPRYILESLRREKIKIGEGIIGEIAQNKDKILIEYASEDSRIKMLDSALAIETFMAVPMLSDANIIGVLCAVNNRKDGEPFSKEQFSHFSFMADQVVLAYNIIKIYSDLSRQQRINQELDFARQLQASLLPKEFPNKEHFSVHAFNRSAKEVGGDFYDFVEIDKDRLLVVVADACGKGIPACLLMAMTRSFIRANVQKFTNLADMMKFLNDALYRDTGDEKYVTVACCLIDHKNNILEYARGGHTELLVKIPGHKVRKIYPKGAASGLAPSDIIDGYETISFLFRSEMTILFFTDGITEALNMEDQEFGIERLTEAFDKTAEEELNPYEMTERILRTVDEFTQGRAQSDDMTLLVIKRC